jgi:5-methyltetrahydrofolate--homocysteine methyltransferase
MNEQVLMKQIANNIIEGNYATQVNQKTPAENIPAEMSELVQFYKNKKVLAPMVLSEALDKAINACFKKYETGEFLLPDLIIRAAYTNQIRKILAGCADDSALFSKGKAVLATVCGKDYTHWQEMVDKILKGLGYQTINLGSYATSKNIIKAVANEEPSILGIATPSTSLVPELNSVSTISSIPEIKKLIENLSEKDSRKDLKILIGGNVASIASAEDVGADYRCNDMFQTIQFLKALD